MSQEQTVTIDEFIAHQKGAVKPGDVVLKAFKAPSSWDPKTRTARFTISAQTEDRDRDVVWQEGLDTTSFEQNPVGLLFHSSRSWPIGRWSDVTKNLSGRPKRTEATLNLLPEGTEPDADRAAAHIAAGTLTSCSIGFIPRSVRRREVPEDRKSEAYATAGYDITEAELVEVSIVPVPSLREAAIKAAGGDSFALAREIIEEVLDNWTKHPETGLLVPRAEFEAAYKEATGERTSVAVTPPAPVAPNPPTPPEPSLIRRAINAIMGKGEVPPDVDAVSASAIARVMEADRARAQRLKDISQAHQRFMRRHQAYERATALKGRLDARGLT